jgi:hypothetical protein
MNWWICCSRSAFEVRKAENEGAARRLRNFRKHIDSVEKIRIFRTSDSEVPCFKECIKDMSLSPRTISISAILLVVLASAAAAVAADRGREDRFVPRNDDFRASAERVASQGSSPDCCPADLNCDGIVNGADLGLLLSSWGSWGGSGVFADITGDGNVNGADLGLLLSAWGPCAG